MDKKVGFIGLLTALFLLNCAMQRPYDIAQFRDRDIEYKQLSLNKDGLTKEQIDAISSTKPPSTFPVDISIIIIKKGYIEPKQEDMFSFPLVNELKKSDKIDRITLLPDFLIPKAINFNDIQELGVRSLSEYVLIFYLDANELFNWTKILETKFEISSAVSFILVDSYTTAMLTSEKLYSTQFYNDELFKLGEREKAQNLIFAEQATLLANKINILFKK